MLRPVDHSAEDHFLSFKKGEEQGFTYFFHLYYKHLVHFAFTFLKQTSIAEDVVGDCFLKFWEKRESIASLPALKPYLFTSVRNRCLDVLRREVHADNYSVHITRLPPEFTPDVTQKMITAEAMHQVYLALQNLPCKYRQLFQMIYVEGKEMKEIAKELNLPLSTLKSQKARTLELLRRQLPHLGALLIFFLLGT